MTTLEFVGYVPEWGEVEILEEEDIETAKELAIEEIKKLYPEMVDIEILNYQGE